ncbi:MAG: class I tRNA ligase family protein, partial [Protaetiibacter sp.]
GQKMSKSLRNYPDVSEVFDRDGADAMRWFLLSGSVIRGGNLIVTEEGIRQGVREVMLPLWSSYYFFTLYANSAGVEAVRRTDSAHPLDRYLLAKTRDVIHEVTARLDDFDTPLAAEALREFADVLTNWYVRRSRDRFWAGDDRDAFDTLYTVLETFTRLAAPLLPLVSEEIWRGLTGGRSVHLEDWPDAGEFPVDTELVRSMDRVREIASSGLALRKARQLRVRLPLARLTVVAPDAAGVEGFSEIVRDELNVKALAVAPLVESSLADYGIARRLTVNARALGPRIGKDVQRVIQAAKAGDWSVDGELVTAGGVALEAGEYELELTVADPASAIAFLPSGGFVVLDTAVTPELAAEGYARDFVRRVQQARRDAGLEVVDRISLEVEASAAAAGALETHRALVADAVLATAFGIRVVDAVSDPAVWADVDADDEFGVSAIRLARA